MVIEIAFLILAVETVISTLVGSGAEKLTDRSISKLKGDPARKALQQALAAAIDRYATTSGINTTGATSAPGGSNQSTAEVRRLMGQARMAVQNNDIQGALTNLNSALDALEVVRDGEQSNITATQEMIHGSTTTGAGTIGSGGAEGAGTAGGIITSGST